MTDDIVFSKSHAPLPRPLFNEEQINIEQDAQLPEHPIKNTDPTVGYVGVAEDNSMWLVREVRGNIAVAYLTRITSVDVIHTPRTDDHTPGADNAAVLAADGTGWKIQNRTGDNLNIKFGTLNGMMQPPLPKRVPGKSLADGYAQAAEMRLKAQRLEELHEWLLTRYAVAVAATQFHKQKLYAEILYFIETGKRPLEYPSAMANYEKNLHSKTIAAIEQRDRRTQ